MRASALKKGGCDYDYNVVARQNLQLPDPLTELFSIFLVEFGVGLNRKKDQ